MTLIEDLLDELRNSAAETRRVHERFVQMADLNLRLAGIIKNLALAATASNDVALLEKFSAILQTMPATPTPGRHDERRYRGGTIH